MTSAGKMRAAAQDWPLQPLTRPQREAFKSIQEDAIWEKKMKSGWDGEITKIRNKKTQAQLQARLWSCQEARCCLWKLHFALGIMSCHGGRFLCPVPRGSISPLVGTPAIAISVEGLTEGLRERRRERASAQEGGVRRPCGEAISEGSREG